MNCCRSARFALLRLAAALLLLAGVAAVTGNALDRAVRGPGAGTSGAENSAFLGLPGGRPSQPAEAPECLLATWLGGDEADRRSRARKRNHRAARVGLEPHAVGAEPVPFHLLGDPAAMLEVLRRELPRRASVPIRITHCAAEVQRSRAALCAGRIRVLYSLRVHVGDEERELVLLGTAPESSAFLEGAACRALRGHAALAPFVEPALHVAELQLGLRFYPLDPRLPALSEIERGGADELLASYLRNGDDEPVEGVERELCHYKPFKRAVWRVQKSTGSEPRPALYAKLFANRSGNGQYREQSALFAATRSARALRLPEPLAYDRTRRMLLMAEAPGPAALVEWIKRLESGQALPRGVDLARVRRCLAVAAEALAELQSSGIEPRARRGFRRELGGMAKDRRLLREGLWKRHPALVCRVEDLVTRLRELAPRREELVPAHGGFRHKQTIGDERALTIIDWDGLCLADGALDPATFLLRLRTEPLRAPGSGAVLQELADGFRREFLARAPRVTPERLALYEGLTITQDALRTFRRDGDDAASVVVVDNLAAAASEALDRARGA